LGLKPLLNLDMRLGEGTGAALGIFLAETAAKVLAEMAAFAEAGVSEKEERGS
jgi:nicotinate-nucleotide--dimethylbenzimidazole phosphoribosyltransferase